MSSGVLDNNFVEGGANLRGISLVQVAFTEHFLGSWGYPFIVVCLLFFAFSTVIGWYYFGESNIRYLFDAKALLPYKILVMAFIFTGSVLKIDLVWDLIDLVWDLSDFFNGIMVIPNLIAILFLSNKVARLLRECNE